MGENGGRGFGGGALEKTFFGCFLHPFLVGFRDMVFVDGFLIIVNKLGFLTNSFQWIRGLDIM
jgi:hypothetical protein